MSQQKGGGNLYCYPSAKGIKSTFRGFGEVIIEGGVYYDFTNPAFHPTGILTALPVPYEGKTCKLLLIGAGCGSLFNLPPKWQVMAVQ